LSVVKFGDIFYIGEMKKRPNRLSTADEARRIRDALNVVLKQQQFPYGIRQFDLEFGEDSTGDPAVWILFPIDDDPDPSTEKLSSLNRLVHQTRDMIREYGVTRWPYVRFRAAS
jgi:hypothetical protein